MLPRPVLVLLACSGCAHPVTARAPSPTGPAQITAAPDTPALPAPALGPADREPPAPPSAAAPSEFVARGPVRPIGAAPVRRARPDAPGRRGALLLAIDTPYQLFGRASSYVHVAAWYPDGRPAAGADVFVDRRGVGRTDRHGTLVFRRSGRDGAAQAVDDGATLFVVAPGDRCGAVGFTPYARTPAFAISIASARTSAEVGRSPASATTAMPSSSPSAPTPSPPRSRCRSAWSVAGWAPGRRSRCSSADAVVEAATTTPGGRSSSIPGRCGCSGEGMVWPRNRGSAVDPRRRGR